jgi:hypothetical protein
VFMSKDLPRNRRLILVRDWERDEGLLEGAKGLDGTLPGGGVTYFSVLIEKKADRDVEKQLQTLTFKGGGEVRGIVIPPKSKEAFDKWYKKLVK